MIKDTTSWRGHSISRRGDSVIRQNFKEPADAKAHYSHQDSDRGRERIGTGTIADCFVVLKPIQFIDESLLI